MALKTNKLDKRDTRMQMGLHLFEPLLLRVYFSMLQWPSQPKGAATPNSEGVTWLELLLDFCVAHGSR